MDAIDIRRIQTTQKNVSIFSRDNEIANIKRNNKIILFLHVFDVFLYFFSFIFVGGCWCVDAAGFPHSMDLI